LSLERFDVYGYIRVTEGAAKTSYAPPANVVKIIYFALPHAPQLQAFSSPIGAEKSSQRRSKVA
jgi:hypothetical protein